ncbi:MAG TPA: 3-oxoadipyl-CoA thiolase, partial [Advenella sp.]|nr:3-oxoadipyl-CoA thiolase [Advenella sp.]
MNNLMQDAFVCDAIRTPFGRYGGALSTVRTDDLAALPISAIMKKNEKVDWSAVDDVVFGCANQAGEDNRNVARMATLLAGLPVQVPASTLNRLCASGLDAIGTAARAIKSGDAQLMIAGGVESMSRSPYVVGKASSPFSRQQQMFDTTLGWRFVNPLMKQNFGIDSMPETAENVATQFGISRQDQDAFAYRSQQRATRAIAAGLFDHEIMPVTLIGKKSEQNIVTRDEHPRETSLEKLAQLKPIVSSDGTITAGNASGVNDGACAVLLASGDAAKKYGLEPRARVVGMAFAGVEPRIMGFGPAPAVRKVLALTGLRIQDMDVIELNEAFAAQALAVTRDLGLADDAAHVNPNGGA